MKATHVAMAGIGAFLGGIFVLSRFASASDGDYPTVVVPTCDELASGAVVVENAPSGRCSSCGRH